MKLHLGKYILFFILFTNTFLFASSYIWSASANKTKVVVNEAIHLTYICEFSDRGDLYTIDFYPMGDYDEYKIVLLKENEFLKNNKRINTYEFIAYAKKDGEIAFNFDMSMQKTTQESINYTTKSRDDDRDNEDFTATILRQETLYVEVQDSDSEIVGDFTIAAKKDKTEIQSFEPYHMEIIIKGVGNFDSIQELNYEIDGVKVFTQKPILEATLGADGKNGVWSQKLAFVGEKDFSIPKLVFSYYSISQQKIVKLVLDEIKLSLKKVYKKEELLDTQEEDNGEISFAFIYYMLTFLAGFLVSQIPFKRKFSRFTKDDDFTKQIKKVKILDKLVFLLAIRDSKKYEEIITKVESGDVTTIKEIKQYLGI